MGAEVTIDQVEFVREAGEIDLLPMFEAGEGRHDVDSHGRLNEFVEVGHRGEAFSQEG